MIKMPTEEALAYTEAEAIEGLTRPRVLLWQEPEGAAALGISQSAERELNIENIREDGIRVIRRQSGGGAVILTPDVLCFEVIAPISNTTEDLSIRESFEFYTRPLINVLIEYGLNATISGISDITVESDDRARKVAGCAQLRKRRALVVHTSILINLDKNLLERYLDFPSEVPDYRANRSHSDFCLNLSEIIPGLTSEALNNKLESEFCKSGWQIIQNKPESSELSRELLEKKYSQEDWNIDRKRPKMSKN